MNPENQNTSGLEAGLQSIAAAISNDNLATFNVMRQNDTTNAQANGAKIKTGWGVIANVASPSISESIVFDAAFSSIPIILVSVAGDNSSNGGYGAGGNLIEGRILIKHTSQTASGFTVFIHTAANTNFGAGYTYYTWVAIGN